VHLLHKTPPNDLEGLFLVLGIFLNFEGNKFGTPFKIVPQVAQTAFEGRLLL